MKTILAGKTVALLFLILTILAGLSPAVQARRIMEYTDNEYNYTFKFPSDWVERDVVEQSESGDIRILLQGPRANSIMVLVNSLGPGREISKDHFESIPNRNTFVEQMINYTVNQIYRSTSLKMNASRMIVVEKQIRPSETGIRFYISTLHFVNDVPLGLAGIHTIPFGEDHIIGFVMSSILDSQTMDDNETFKQIFNSFRLINERTEAPSSFFGGMLDTMASWFPFMGDLGWKYRAAHPISRSLYLWLPMVVLLFLAVRYGKIVMRKHHWRFRKLH